jgi:hypothetical protein
MSGSRLIKSFAEFLSQKGFEIVNEDDISQQPPSEYKYAKQIFTNKAVLLSFLLKAALTIKDTDSRFTFRLDRPEDYGKLWSFLDSLKDDGYILNWSQNAGVHEIRLSQDAEKTRFFRSEWAEMCFRYVIMKVVQQFCQETSPALSYKVFQNVEIRKASSEKELFTELDIVVQIENRFYIFEIKSGPWIRIMQWAKREEAFVDKQGCARQIVCTVHDNIPANIFEPQILMTIGGIEKRLSKLLKNDFSPPNHPTT